MIDDSKRYRYSAHVDRLLIDFQVSSKFLGWRAHLLPRHNWTPNQCTQLDQLVQLASVVDEFHSDFQVSSKFLGWRAHRLPRRNWTPNQCTQLVQLVQLASVCAVQGLKWEFVVVDQPDANAFVVPGGKVVVFTGLERMLSELSFTCLLA